MVCTDEDRVELSVMRHKCCVVAGKDFGSMIIMSVLSQFGLLKSACIHDWISVKQLVRVECVAGR